MNEICIIIRRKALAVTFFLFFLYPKSHMTSQLTMFLPPKLRSKWSCLWNAHFGDTQFGTVLPGLLLYIYARQKSRDCLGQMTSEGREGSFATREFVRALQPIRKLSSDRKNFVELRNAGGLIPPSSWVGRDM